MGKRNRVRHAFAGTTRQTRLRVDEGLIPHPDERGLRTRDRSGQRLRDVVDPKTGFCTGVRGPMESDGVSVRAADPVSGAGTPLPEFDAATGSWWVGSDRLVVRTTADPDGPLRRVRVVKTSRKAAESDGSTAEKIISKKGGKSTERKPVRRRNPTFSPSEIREFLRVKFGYEGPVTKQIRSAAVSAMTKAITVAEYERDMQAGR